MGAKNMLSLVNLCIVKLKTCQVGRWWEWMGAKKHVKLGEFVRFGAKNMPDGKMVGVDGQ